MDTKMRNRTRKIQLITAAIMAFAMYGWALIPRDFCLMRLVSESSCCKQSIAASCCPCGKQGSSCCAAKQASSHTPQSSNSRGHCFQISSTDSFLALPHAFRALDASPELACVLHVLSAVPSQQGSSGAQWITPASRQAFTPGESCVLRI